MQPEECLARRSTLYTCLTTPAPDNITSNNYPIPEQAGIISQNVGKLTQLKCGILPNKPKLFSAMDQKSMSRGQNTNVSLQSTNHEVLVDKESSTAHNFCPYRQASQA